MSSPSSRRHLWLGRSLLGLAVVLLWMTNFDWPDPISDYLDASWQSALAAAHEQGRAFGNGIIFTAGPLGFLNSHFVTPGTLELKLAWELAGKLLLAGLFVALTAPLGAWRRAVFLVVALLTITFFPDTFFVLLLVLAVIRWLLPPDAPRARVVLALVLLAFLAQVKFTHCLLAALGVGLAVAARALRRDGRGAAGVALGFGVAFLALWLAAGQNPVRLRDYFRYSWQVSAGYPWAMSWDETWPMFWTGVVTALLAAAWVWRIWRGSAESRLAAAPLPLFLAGAWFLAWKHGFTRADGHVLGFFIYTLLLALALPALLAPEQRRWWCLALVPLCGYGIWLNDSAMLPQAPGNFVSRLQMSSYGLRHPHQVRVNFAAALAREKQRHALPAVRATVGAGTVDLLNYEQGLLLLNDLNYHPRPVPQSYSVYTGPLLQKNAGFFRRPGAPDFVVVRFATIDGRFPAQDDSLVLAELPLRYDLALADSDTLVFRRKPQPAIAGAFALKRRAERDAALGAEIAVPAADGHPVWLEATFPLSWIGRLRAALYRPPQLFMVVTDDHEQTTRHRIIPTIAPTGFLLQPLLLTSSDYANFARGKAAAAVRSIRFEAAEPGEMEFWARGKVCFSSLPELPLTRVDPMQAVVDAGIANIAPRELKSDTTVEYFALPDGQPALLVHATGSMSFQLEREATRPHTLAFEYGIRAEAYAEAGRTDGAEFRVEAEFEDARKSTIWQRVLRPRENPADGGTQRVTVDLPAGARRVVLRTLPGPKGDSGWDWTYFARVTFSP